MKPDLLFRLITPKNWTMSAVVGGSAAVAGDLIGFFSNLASPFWLVGVFGAALAIFAVLCVRKALAADGQPEPEVERVVECRECDGMRFSLFGTGVFLILALVGQGETVTERIARQLDVIEDNTTVTREGVEDIQTALASTTIVEDADTAAELFNNAWIYLRHRDQGALALAELDRLYEDFAPRKIDAAELYAAAGRGAMNRQQIIDRMVALGRSSGDETLLIVAARQVEDEAARTALREEARRMAPDQPFAWFDTEQYNEAVMASNGTPGEMERRLADLIVLLDRAIPLLEGRPAGDFYYKPTFAADPLEMAEMYRTTAQSQISSFAQMRAAGQRRP